MVWLVNCVLEGLGWSAVIGKRLRGDERAPPLSLGINTVK